jgi:hypothetical protein
VTRRYTHRVASLAQGTLRYAIDADQAPLGRRAALERLGADAAFRDYLSERLREVAFAAYRLELPPLSVATAGEPFEFVVVDDPWLEVPAEPAVFAGHFEPPADAPVRAVANLGGTARLVVPRQIAAAEHYAHLARFLRGAPAPQVHALWQCVASSALADLDERPLWVSTAGGGVAWLHVRIERRPKYYRHRPYASAG